jgi:hypothetical protein
LDQIRYARFPGSITGKHAPGYDKYKEVVGPFHWTPLEIFTKAFPESKMKAEEITVISWIIPHREAVKADNRKETAFTSERWARARIFGEQVNAKLRKEVVDALQKEGHRAVAPQLFPDWSRKPSEKYVFASTWSERHAAHASGLGTFGLCDGLITPVGKAMRVGSVVSNIDIPPTPRPYTHHQEYCLFLSEGLCKQCIPRCPVGALSENGHDKEKCRNFIRLNLEKYVKKHFGQPKKICRVVVIIGVKPFKQNETKAVDLMPPLTYFHRYLLDNTQTYCYLNTTKAVLRTTRERVSGNVLPVLWG